MMPSGHSFYIVWTGALHLGDTPGVFGDAQFAGLLLHIPIRIGYLGPGDPVRFLLMTTEVEIINGKTHPVYWDWKPGDPLSTPVGYINDTDPIPGKPEYHLLEVPRSQCAEGTHTITIHVNPDIPAGMRDDFVLKRLEADNNIGVSIGWK